jgi:hypothetical protein
VLIHLFATDGRIDLGSLRPLYAPVLDCAIFLPLVAIDMVAELKTKLLDTNPLTRSYYQNCAKR